MSKKKSCELRSHFWVLAPINPSGQLLQGSRGPGDPHEPYYTPLRARGTVADIYIKYNYICIYLYIYVSLSLYIRHRASSTKWSVSKVLIVPWTPGPLGGAGPKGLLGARTQN